MPDGDIYSRTLGHAPAPCTKGLVTARHYTAKIRCLGSGTLRSSILARTKISTSNAEVPELEGLRISSSERGTSFYAPDTDPQSGRSHSVSAITANFASDLRCRTILEKALPYKWALDAMNAPVILPWLLQRSLEAASRVLLDPGDHSSINFSRPYGEAGAGYRPIRLVASIQESTSLFIGGVTAVIMELAEPRVRTGCGNPRPFV